MDEINARIRAEVCHTTLRELSDENLMDEYRECKSVKIAIERLRSVLAIYVDEETRQNIIQDYLIRLIPAGTKGVIRGNKFNRIVKSHIVEFVLDTNRFDVCFEKKSIIHPTTEIPDWYILDKETNKLMIGMNQLDLWSGGQQLNRGSKYLDTNTYQNIKLVCVVSNPIQFKSQKNKAYKLFEIGFERDTLCYLNHLHTIIREYFGL